MEIKNGSVVISSAGHDKGRFMLVVGADGERVYLADGKERKLSHPKQKNLKHIRATRFTIDPAGLTDKRLRQTLSSFAKAGEQVTGE